MTEPQDMPRRRPRPERGPKGGRHLSRRGFLATGAAAVAATTLRGVPILSRAPRGRHVLTLVYDKSIGAMRAIDRFIP